MDKHYQCASVFAPYINEFITQKRAQGYSYDDCDYYLKRFDGFCVEHHISEPVITRQLFEAWIEKGASSAEGKSGRHKRETIFRAFSIYMNILETECYIPHHICHLPKVMQYLMSDSDIQEFFSVLDGGRCRNNDPDHIRMYSEYRVMFRMICCCGLRNSEACELRRSNIDLEKGIITIIHSKGDKDRLVYMADDLTELCQSYWLWMTSEQGIQSDWFYPSKDTSKHIIKHSVCRKFNEIWTQTAASKLCDKKPTVHSFRHYFVTKRMNLWMEQGVDLNAMMPFLSNYLGHAGVLNTHYYYHAVEDSIKIIRSKDKVSSAVIPEVITDE